MQENSTPKVTMFNNAIELNEFLKTGILTAMKSVPGGETLYFLNKKTKGYWLYLLTLIVISVMLGIFSIYISRRPTKSYLMYVLSLFYILFFAKYAFTIITVWNVANHIGDVSLKFEKEEGCLSMFNFINDGFYVTELFELGLTSYLLLKTKEGKSPQGDLTIKIFTWALVITSAAVLIHTLIYQYIVPRTHFEISFILLFFYLTFHIFGTFFTFFIIDGIKWAV